MNKSTLRKIDIFEAPFIEVKAKVIQPGAKNGIPNIKEIKKYSIAPSAIKIARYMVNQIFGSDIVTDVENLNISWLMPTLKETLKNAIYEEESFIYIHKFDNKIYLENIMKNEIHNLVQKWDKLISGIIIQDIEGVEDDYVLKREFKIEEGKTYLEFKAYIKDKNGKEKQIPIEVFNKRTGNDYESKYILPYEAIINIDLGENFFEDSEKELNEEMNVINVIAEEIEKTKTRIATTQHYQTGDIVSQWQPGSTRFNVEQLSVGKLNDYFTLLPGDKEHQLFQFLQGNIRTKDYIETFKFYDYQIIQNAGLSPASFGYEKDAYMNKDNVNMSKNSSDMTIEAIKTQIEPQINKLIENIIKAQQSTGIKINELPNGLSWDYGSNEKIEDLDKITIIKKMLGVLDLPYKVKAEVILPLLKRLVSSDLTDEINIESLVSNYEKEQNDLKIKYGEI